jgi:predicted dehydrogenase
MPQGKNVNRREFFKKATTLAAGAVVFPYVIRSSALGKAGRVAPSNRIVVGCIGNGIRGGHHLSAFLDEADVQVAAVCDVKSTAREAARNQANRHYGNESCAGYNHFQELLARDDIDAVSIATNDHWHVLHAVAAVRAGKDIYVEKPLGMTLDELKVLRSAVKQHGRVFQFGTQQRSDRNFRFACELVQNGRIGTLQTTTVGVHAGAAERSGLKTYSPEPVPEGFDYALWLGPAPEAPFTPKRVINPHWFHISDYSLGYVSGWGVHHIDIAQWGNGTELTGPVAMEGTAQFPSDDALCDNPVSWDVHFKYANGLTMRFAGSGPGFEGVRHGITFQGTDGWIWVNREGIEAQPESLLQEKIGPDEVHLPVSDHHMRNFIDCIKTRSETICPIEIAVRSDSVCQLGWIAFQLQRKLQWDPEKEEFVNDMQANRMLKRTMRQPWSL